MSVIKRNIMIIFCFILMCQIKEAVYESLFHCEVLIGLFIHCNKVFDKF